MAQLLFLYLARCGDPNGPVHVQDAWLRARFASLQLPKGQEVDQKSKDMTRVKRFMLHVTSWSLLALRLLNLEKLSISTWAQHLL